MQCLYRLILAIEWFYCKCCTPWPWPIFSRSQNSWKYIFNIWKTVKASEESSSTTFIEVNIYPSNGAIANVVHHDLDLYFQGHIVSLNHIILHIWKTVRASEQCSSTTLMEFDTSHRMVPLRMFIVTLIYIFKVRSKFLEII